MSTISAEEVARVAELAYIALTQEEIDRLAGELAIIADAAGRVSEVASADIPPSTHPMSLQNVMRNDVVGPVLDRERLLAGAPDAEDGMFKVPQILEEEQ